MIIEKLESGDEWAWCSVKVIVEYDAFSAIASLGCCSYKNRTDFIHNSGYYQDMVQECYEDIVTQMSA